MGNDVSRKGKYAKMDQAGRTKCDSHCETDPVTECELFDDDSSSTDKMKQDFFSLAPSGYQSVQVHENNPENKQDGASDAKNSVDNNLKAVEGK